MRIRFSARAWMLSAAAASVLTTGLVFLPSLDVEAQVFRTQRKPVTASSGTASSEEMASDEKSPVQRRLDSLYLKFGRKPEPAGRKIPTEHIASGPDSKAAPEKADDKAAPEKADDVKQAAASKSKPEVRRPVIRQVSGLTPDYTPPAPNALPAPAEPRKLIELPASRSAIEKPQPAEKPKSTRRFFPSLFSRRKPASQPQSAPRPASGGGSVQDHLKKLYERDGREMPPMELGQLPGADTGQEIAPLPAPAKPAPLPRLSASTPKLQPESEPIRTVSNNPFKRLIRRISPFKKKSTEAKPIPAPPQSVAEQRALENPPLNPFFGRKKENQSLVPPPPAGGKTDGPVFSEPAPVEPAPITPAPIEVTPIQPAPIEAAPIQPTPFPPAPIKPAEAAPEIGIKRPVESPAETSAAPLEFPELKPRTGLPKTPVEQPAVPEIEPADPPSLDVKVSDEPFGTEKPAARPADSIENPFPALSEQGADKPSETPAESAPAEPQPKPAEEKKENPFTGLTLEAPEPKPMPAAEPKPPGLLLPNPGQLSPGTAKPKIEKPNIEKPAELPAFPSTTEAPPPLSAAGAPKLIVRPESRPAPTVPEIDEPAKSKPKPQPAAEPTGPHADKLRKIAERAELTGLKGFCPVQLRDERALQDARPQFSVTYNGVVYNFSSAAARRKFQAKPYIYAPAASGQDVVLAAGSDDRISGSLDHAVWYRDRLYLFQSGDSLKSFVASPGKYARQSGLK